MTDELRIAVLGAGYVGSAFAAAAADKHEVWAVRRTTREAHGDRVTWLSGDVARGEVNGMPPRLDVVALTIAPSGAGDSYEDTYPLAAHSAVLLARETGARALIYTSSTGVYGGCDGAWVTEESERLGAGESNAALTKAEDIVLGSADASATVLRLAGIYGPGRDPQARMRHAAQLPQRGEYWVNLAHRDDIVSAMLHVLQLPSAASVLNVCDGAPALAADVARWLAARDGADPAALQFGNDAQRSRNNQRVSNARLIATGWAPRYATFRHGFEFGF